LPDHPARSKVMDRAIAIRLALFYGAVFASVGVHLPYWPVWLEARGLSAAEIGILLAASFWPRIVTNLVLPLQADRLGQRRRPMILLTAVTFVGLVLFGLADGFWAFLALSVMVGASWASILPLGEALVLRQTRERRIDYGRVRLWGSITFILAVAPPMKSAGAVVHWITPSGMILCSTCRLRMNSAAWIASGVSR
jgi:MFS transporter, PPP family, 3-phenylpropionic acid transporter